MSRSRKVTETVKVKSKRFTNPRQKIKKISVLFK